MLSKWSLNKYPLLELDISQNILQKQHVRMGQEINNTIKASDSLIVYWVISA